MVNTINGQYFALECDYEYFEKNFWSRVINFKDIIKRMNYSKDKRETFKTVTPMVAWTEIYSVIKGHC
jgi:hypothetical protein